MSDLFAAASDGQLNTVERLIAEGVDVNATSDKDGQTPVCIAAKEGHVAIVDKLVQAGADLKIADKYGYTPLHWVAEKGLEECVKIMLQLPDIAAVVRMQDKQVSLKEVMYIYIFLDIIYLVYLLLKCRIIFVI